MFSSMFLSETCFARKSVALHKDAAKPGVLCTCSVVLGFGCSFGYIFTLCVSTPVCVPSTCGRRVEPRRKLACSATGSAPYLTAPFEDEPWAKSCAFRKPRRGRLPQGSTLSTVSSTEFYQGTRAPVRSRGGCSPKAMASSS